MCRARLAQQGKLHDIPAGDFPFDEAALLFLVTELVLWQSLAKCS